MRKVALLVLLAFVFVPAVPGSTQSIDARSPEGSYATPGIWIETWVGPGTQTCWSGQTRTFVNEPFVLSITTMLEVDDVMVINYSLTQSTSIYGMVNTNKYILENQDGDWLRKGIVYFSSPTSATVVSKHRNINTNCEIQNQASWQRIGDAHVCFLWVESGTFHKRSQPSLGGQGYNTATGYYMVTGNYGQVIAQNYNAAEGILWVKVFDNTWVSTRPDTIHLIGQCQNIPYSAQ